MTINFDCIFDATSNVNALSKMRKSCSLAFLMLLSTAKQARITMCTIVHKCVQNDVILGYPQNGHFAPVRAGDNCPNLTCCQICSNYTRNGVIWHGL